MCSCIAALTLRQVSGWWSNSSCRRLPQIAHLSCGSFLAWPCTGRSQCHGQWSLDTQRVSEGLWRLLEFGTRTRIPGFFIPLGKPRCSESLDAEFAFMIKKALRNWCQGSYFLQCEDGTMIANHNSSCRATCTSGGSLWVDEGRVEARCCASSNLSG